MGGYGVYIILIVGVFAYTAVGTALPVYGGAQIVVIGYIAKGLVALVYYVVGIALAIIVGVCIPKVAYSTVKVYLLKAVSFAPNACGLVACSQTIDALGAYRIVASGGKTGVGAIFGGALPVPH